MAKSKKNKLVHLTQVRKKGKDHKEDLIKQIEQYVTQFKRCFIFDFEGSKSDRIMNLRLRLKETGRIFAGRNSLVTVSLKAIGSRTGTNFEDFAKHVTGHRGLLFTDIKCEQLIEKLDKELPEFREKLLGYAQIAPDTITMDVDSSNDPNGGEIKKKIKKTRKKGEKREVKFVKI